MTNNNLITGLPTLMAVYNTRLAADGVREQLCALNYPLADVSVYHRLKGTDQVLDASTGQVAAGQALTEEEITARMLENLETVVLLHPPDAQLQAIQDALAALGQASFLHESDTQCIRRASAGRVLNAPIRG